MADTLDAAEVADRLRGLPAWSRDGDQIRRQVTAPSFPAGIEVVADVARAAEDADHHPDIDIRWRTLTFALSTHSAGGLTGKDFDLAATIDRIAARHGAG
ncbi:MULTISPECIES: 4a-hydroxytetrahydrobiopterin dehydratase [Actinomadura]|jgi:4a-hydroxytetrahydrobiopterin dehydratase|uniref:Putative pterin-4-alpha-carbinolamine dehydratase n=1 Tax=Actinomadura citrea TaxID=46158 RepID=A0A7Y9GCV0_9ACTN|nr:4a-hydroxytetrahydrobiopterin dehydratase [Actinomadura citrea]NYE14162.1 4a-hydroxytetrahydrobiopterin dehydratase [Actinomadura citrea]GGU02542.1 4a-hydroxytetrahydrobiopterin dehydratase [Actinomadura citrea]